MCSWQLVLISIVHSMISPMFAQAQAGLSAEARLAKHAEVFRHQALPAGSARLEDIRPNAQGVIYHQRTEIAEYMHDFPPLTPEQEIGRLTARFDAIVMGVATQRHSAIDPTHTFLYSDWVIKVSKVFKYPTAFQVGSEVTITRLGGDLTLDGRRIIDETPLFPDLALGRQYVFFLKALPDTASFLAVSGATFDVSGATPFLVADPHNPTAMRAFGSGPTAELISAVERSVVR